MLRIGVFFCAAVVLFAVCGTGLGAITTVSYQVSAGADDGYAWSATEQDVGGIYLMVGDRWYSTPYFMSGMRFAGVGIPRSARIVSANLQINSGQDENGGHIYAVISGEAVDDAADFGSRYIADAVQGPTSVDWDHKFAWAKHAWFVSPDISSVVQEVVDRGGWSLGNSLALFYSTRTDSGKSRGFNSFEDGNSPVVEISYETYTISGHVTTSDGNGLSGVAVSVGSDIEGTVTDSSGYYELLVPPGWSGTVTVAKSDWGFSPSSRVYSSVSSDALSEDYAAIQPVISGHITDGVGTGIDGVSVVSDNDGGSDTTDATGFYAVTVPYNWTGTVTPDKAGWGCEPLNHTYSVGVVADTPDQNYTMIQPRISGYVRDGESSGVSGVIISSDNGGGSDTTDGTGFYEVIVPYGWTGTITAIKTGWNITPPSQSYSSNVVADHTNQDYTAFQPKISGYVRDANSVGVHGVSVSSDNGGGSDTTDPDGYYEFAVPYEWSGTVTAYRLGWEITPQYHSYSNVISDQSNQDFLAVNIGIVVKKNGAGDFTTIQAAIDGANNGDIVTVHSGTYIENINFDNKNIILTSTDPNDPNIVELTIIDGSNVKSVVTFSGNESANCILTGFTITNGNTSTNGGGINGNFALAAIKYCFISNNYGMSGGGIARCNGSISNCQILNNTAFTGGGLNSCGGTISNCFILDNSADYYSGGLHNCDGVIVDCIITGNSTAYKGGGLYGCDGTIDNCTVSYNSSRDGGGLFGCNGNIINCKISNNTSSRDGGGLYSCNLIISNCTISNNSSDNHGGGLYDCESEINGCLISGNSARSLGGGLSHCDNTIENCNIIENSAGDGGGLAYCHGTISNCRILNNTVVRNGAGFYDGDGVIKNCTISGNHAGQYGGGLYRTSAKVIYCIIVENSASREGGGLHSCGNIISNCVISKNTAGGEGPGLRNCNATIQNCTIIDNQSNNGSGLEDCSGLINNCVIWNNSLKFGKYSLYHCSVPSYSCINSWDGSGIGNISIDPRLDNDEIHLLAGSPCIEGGDPNYVASPNETDIDGDARIVGNVDMGADEFFSAQPLIFLVSEEFQFLGLQDRSNPVEQTLLLRNYGVEDLSWSISEDCSWLEVSTSSGVIAFGDQNDVNLGVNISGLPAGFHSCDLTILDPQAINSPFIVSIYLEIIGPSLSIDSNEFNFTASMETIDPLAQSLRITNLTGGGTLNWSIASDCNWVVAEPNSGAITEGFMDVMLDIDQNNIEYGHQSCQLIVEAVDANNSPQYVNVNLDVLRPDLAVSPLEFYFETSLEGPNETGQALSIENIGYDTLHWDINVPNDCNWLKVSAYTGQTDSNEVNDVILSIDHNNINYGIYSCEFTIMDPCAVNSPQVVAVNLEVSRPELSVSSTSFYFDTALDEPNDSNQILTIQNTGHDTLYWQIYKPPDCNWLHLSVLNGESTGETDEVVLSVDANGLDTGFYFCDLIVSASEADNSPQTVSVGLMNLREAGKLYVPYDYNNIQAAVDAAVDGDEVVIVPGRYVGEGNFDVVIGGKAITVRSIDPNNPAIVAATIVDGNSTMCYYEWPYCDQGNDYEAGFGFIFEDGEEANSVLEGLTIIGAGWGGGVDVWQACPTIRKCVIRDNRGNGILANVTGEMTITDCTIKWNSPGEMGGGGIRLYGWGNGSVIIRNCVINNHWGYGGGGIRYNWWDEGNPPLEISIYDCVISENSTLDGGGINISDGNCVIVGCVIRDNSAFELGGGVYFGDDVNVSISDSIIRDNSADVDGGGGYFGNHVNISIIDSSILGNSAGEEGGGLYFSRDNNSTITGCRISDNRAQWGGGGISHWGPCYQKITNSIISGNIAGDGGAVDNGYPGTISNSTIVGNRSNYTFSGRAGIRISNSIVWDNLTNSGELLLLLPDPCYTCIEGGYTGTGNIDVDPCFAVPGYWHPNDTPIDANDDYWVEGDYHLKSEAGRWEPSIYTKIDQGGDGIINLREYAVLARDWQENGGFLEGDLDYSGKVDGNDLKILLDGYMTDYTEGQWVFDDVSSLCIDAADPNSDWTQELWPHGQRINMGAYGGTSEASMSLNSIGNIADLNHDGVVNFEDFAWFAKPWKIEQVLLAEDFDRNGVIDWMDFKILCDNWLTQIIIE